MSISYKNSAAYENLEGPDERGEGNPLKRNNEIIFSLAHASAGRCVAVSRPIDTHPCLA